jgi:hypothetical protein
MRKQYQITEESSQVEGQSGKRYVSEVVENVVFLNTDYTFGNEVIVGFSLVKT